MNAVFVWPKRPVFFPESLALGFHSNLGSWLQALWFYFLINASIGMRKIQGVEDLLELARGIPSNVH